MPPLLWQAQGRVYLSSLLLVNKLELGEKIINSVTLLRSLCCRLFEALIGETRWCARLPIVFHHILSLNALQLMNIKRCLYVIVVIILIKLEVVGPNDNSFCSARARAVCRCCLKRFIIFELCDLLPDKCCRIDFNNRHISLE